MIFASQRAESIPQTHNNTILQAARTRGLFGIGPVDTMSNVRAWFEGELRRMLGFDEVEEIARFALESFSTSQSVELRQYLQQFLGESKEVNKLCNDLVARRTGTATPRKSSPALVAASNDFWGGGGGSLQPARSTPTARSGREGQQEQERNHIHKGKKKGKLYQKAAAEEFWGGGTTSAGASGKASSTATPTAAPARAATASAAAPIRTPVLPKKVSSHVATAGEKNDTKPQVSKPQASAVALTNVVLARASPAAAGGTGTAGSGNGTTTLTSNSGGIANSTAATAARAAASAAKTVTPAVIEKFAEWSGVTCLCMGTKHGLVTNCTTCGKIACMVEGGFGCSFCGSPLPATGREPRKAGGGTGTTEIDEVQSAALKKAQARKDKLLLFDRTSASRTRVLDDQGDYFTSHNWLSQKEREKGEAEEKARRDDAAQRRGARRQVKVSIDIMGRRVVETRDAVDGKVTKEGGGVTAATEGISIDFGSTGGDSTCGGGVDGGTNGGVGNSSTPEVNGGRKPSGTEEGAEQRPSLENTGLRGRAKEIYDVMRANLEKQGRRQRSSGGVRGNNGTGEMGGKSRGGVDVETSRMSLWRVQHDVAPDGVLRHSSVGGHIDSSSGAAAGTGGMEKFEPRDEIPCR